MRYMQLGLFAIALLSVTILNNSEIFAQSENKFTKIEGQEIKNNPVAQDMIRKIEESYKILEQLRSGNVASKVTEAQKLVEDQRKIAKEKLAIDLTAMNKKYEGFTANAAFSKFVSKVNATHQQYYMDQFDYLKNKIKIAESAKRYVLDNGGTYSEAQAEYIRYASMSRTEMVKVVLDLNIKHNFTISERQSYFDENGKLPRYEEDKNSICFNCQEYESMVQKMIFESPTLSQNKK
jgi:hypothetical protein